MKGVNVQAISDNLIHFLGKQYKGSPNEQFKIFKSIINNGLRLNKNSIIFSDNGSVNNDIVCFTDIPLRLCNEHAKYYGKFGIGFKKSSIKKCGGHPVRYFINYISAAIMNMPEYDKYDNRGAMYTNLCLHFKLVKKLKDTLDDDANFALYDQNRKEIFSHKDLEDLVNKQLTVLSFEKETGELGPALDNKFAIDPFYKEREWRIVPLHGNSSSVVRDKETNIYSYIFNRSDINVVVTPNDDTRTEVLRFLLGLENEADDRLKEFARNPLPIITYDDLYNW